MRFPRATWPTRSCRPTRRPWPPAIPSSHPLFARIYHRRRPATDAAGGDEHRRRLLEGLTGQVLDLGAGDGANFDHYPSTVSRIMALEPDPFLRSHARRQASQCALDVIVLSADATFLPFRDASCDAVVSSLLLCSVDDPASVLAEVRRVLVPGGQLRFYEHVGSDAANIARYQRLVEPAWRRLAGGCRLTRDSPGQIADAGFSIERCDRFNFSPHWSAVLTSSHVSGSARRQP